MNPSTAKKVIVARLDREPLAGFVNPHTYLSAAGLELLSANGSLLILPFEEIKAVYFVRDFQAGEPRTEKAFTSRPKQPGLWVRMRWHNGDVMDGIVPNNLLNLESFGFLVVPPNAGFQNQRVFVPRAVLSNVQVLGLIGSPGRRSSRAKPASKEQLEMFGPR